METKLFLDRHLKRLQSVSQKIQSTYNSSESRTLHLTSATGAFKIALGLGKILLECSPCLLCPTRTPPVFVRRPAGNMSLIWKSNKLFAAKGTCYDKQVPFAFPY